MNSEDVKLMNKKLFPKIKVSMVALHWGTVTFKDSSQSEEEGRAFV